MKRLVALVALGAVMAGCTQTQTNGTGGGPNAGTVPGVLRVAIQSDVKNLNPLLASNTTDGMIARLMFVPLITSNDKGEPVPMLASDVPSMANGGISKDGLTVTYHLRKNAKWSDGVAVSSADVKWSWQAVMNSSNNVISRNGYDDISSIDVPDPYTVVVHLKRKFSPFVNTFFADSDSPLSVAPAHVLSKYPDINQIPFNSTPNVTDGPFKFVRWVHGDHISLAANPNFFMGVPGLKEINVRIIPDENTIVNLVKTHEIDWMFEASINNYPAVKDIPGTVIKFVDVNGYEDVQLNVQRPYLQDVRVRQAIAYAMDKQQLIDNLTYGQEHIATEDQPPFMWAYDPNIKPYPHDVQKARQLLQAAGWTPGSDGIMTKNGQRLTLVLVSNSSNVTRRKAALEIQNMMKQAGIEIEVKPYQADVLFAPVGEGGILQGGKFDLSLAGWYSGVDPDDSSQLVCAQVAPKGYNYSRYCTPAMEAAQKMALENYDRPTRTKAYFKIQELLAKDVPEIYDYYERQMHPINSDFKGFDPNPVVESWNAWQWSI